LLGPWRLKIPSRNFQKYRLDSGNDSIQEDSGIGAKVSRGDTRWKLQ
jgi:hypothetical protein